MQDNCEDFLDECINFVPLNSIAYNTDLTEVHTYLVKFISDNDTAESKIQANSIQNNGSQDFLALKYQYEVVGVNALDVVKADKTLDSILYTEDRNPHMW